MSFAAGDNRPWHGDEQTALNVAALLPLATRQVLLAGDELDALAPALSGDTRLSVYGWGNRPPAPDDTNCQGLEAFIDEELEPLPFPPGFIDALVWYAPQGDADRLHVVLPRLAPVLHEDACLLLVIRLDEANEPCPQLESAGWKIHHAWTSTGTDGTPTQIISARKAPYDPRAHAARLMAQGKPDGAHDVLYYLPDHYTPDAHSRAEVALESLEYLLAIPQPTNGPGRLERFARAQWLFNSSAPWLPESTRPFDAFAVFCEQLGIPELGERVRRTGGSQSPSRPTAPTAITTAPPAPVGPSRIQRVLVILGREPDYGLDVLVDGLCTVLGDKNVTPFPYKASLQEGPPDNHRAHYPCYFQRSCPRPSFDTLCRELQQGAFDLILFGDVSHQLDRSMVRTLLHANRSIPLALVDQGDSPTDGFAAMCAYLGRSDCRLGFKRERLAGIPYHENIVPLPFAYPEPFITPWDEAPRSAPLAWSGNASVWMRHHYVARIKNTLTTQQNETQSQQDYVAGLRRCVMAPSFFGAGFDTVRYWEIPAHGALLLAERPPIIVPHNFEDGIHAVFFDDGEEFSEKLRYYISDRERCATIAKAGHEHLRAHHTGAARAQQLLEHVESAYHRV